MLAGDDARWQHLRKLARYPKTPTQTDGLYREFLGLCAFFNVLPSALMGEDVTLLRDLQATRVGLAQGKRDRQKTK